MIDDLMEHYPWIIVPMDVEVEVTEPDQPWSTIHKIPA
jgi:hypothetical protein